MRSGATGSSVLLVLGTLVVFANAARAGLPGDVYPDHPDCKIDIADAVLLERSLAGLVTLTNEQATNANLTPIGGVRDLVTDAGDLVTLKRWLAGDAPLPAPAYDPPTLDAIITDGETNPITVSGTAQTGVSGLQVVLYVNGRALPDAAPVNPTTGEFHFGVGNELKVPLFDGDNEITAIVRKGLDHSCSSASVDTEYHPDSAAVLSVPQQTIMSGSLPASVMVWTPELLAETGDTITVTTSSLTIASGQKLYIMPGVDMKFGNGLKLIVASGGYLQILGSPGNEIELSQDGTCGTVRWGGIEISSSAGPPRPRIEYARVQCTTTAVQVKSGGNFTINNSQITDFSVKGVLSDTGSSFTGISFNTITGNGNGAIGIDAQEAGVFIRGNTIRATGTSSIGIRTRKTQPVNNRWIIERNLVSGSSLAGVEITVEASEFGNSVFNDSVFSQNTITENCRGVRINASNQSPRPRFIGNSIFDNNDHCPTTGSDDTRFKDFTYATNGQSPPNYAFLYGCVGPPGSIDLTGNWWGAVDPGFIADRIDQPTACPSIADYAPFLSAPHDQVGYWVGSPNSNLLIGNVADVATTTPVVANPPPAPGLPWVVAGTVTVPEDMTFTIPDGQVLQFTRHSKILVQGRLIVQDLNAANALFSGLVPPGATSDRGDWQGIVVEPTPDSPNGTLTIDGATIRHAIRAVEAKRHTSLRANVSVRDSLIELFSEAGVYLDRVSNTSEVVDSSIDGTISTGPPLVSIKDVAKRNVSGIHVIDSASPSGCSPTCVEISGNTIRRLVTGIFVQGDSKPEILDNTITENIWGIWLDRLASGEPKPVIQQNRIFANQGGTPVPLDDPQFRFCTNASTGAGSNLCLSNYTSTGTSTLIDATQNYWGTVNESDVREAVRISHGERIAVDQSDFLDANGTIVPGDLLSAVFVSISAVGAASIDGITAANLGGPVIRPTLVVAEDLDITYHLHRAADVTIEIFSEAEPDTTSATPLRVIDVGSQAIGGPYTVSWDGKDGTGKFVPDGAYVFVLVAEHPTTSNIMDRFDPPRNEGVFDSVTGTQIVGDRGFGQPGMGSGTVTFNSFVNDYLTFDYQLIQLPELTKAYSSRVTAEVFLRASGAANTCGQSNPIGTVVARPWVDKPLWVGHHNFLWDGRAQFAVGGFSVGQLVPEVVQTPTDYEDFCFYFKVPAPLKPNHVIVAKTLPTLTGTGAAPEIEVRSNPFFVQPSYDHSSALEFKVDQDALVNLKILPPGITDLGAAVSDIEIDGDSQTSGRQPVPANTAFTYHWKGAPETAGSTNLLTATVNGPYTFALEAKNPADPSLVSVYRGVIHVRGESGE